MGEESGRFTPRDIDPFLRKTLEELHQKVLKGKGRPKFGLPSPADLKDESVPAGIVLLGRVLDFESENGIYRVLADGVGQIYAVDAGQAAHPAGAREYRTIPPGTLVLLFLGLNIQSAIIIAQVPDGDTVFRYAPNVMVHGAGGHSPGTDPILRTFYGTSSVFESLPTHIQGRPSDRTVAGEFGITTFTGMGFLVDPFLATVKLDEETGLYVFYFDRHTRLSGRSLELASAISRQLYQHRDGYSTVERGVALHVGEAVGVLAIPPTSAPATVSPTGYDSNQVYQAFLPDYQPSAVPADTVNWDAPWWFMWEPPSGKDFIPYYRYTRYEGALADGGYIEFVSAPSAATSWDDVPAAIYRGMAGMPYAESMYSGSVGLEGFGIYAYRSGFYIGKEPGLPAPIRIRSEIDPDYERYFPPLRHDQDTRYSPGGSDLDELLNAVLTDRLDAFQNITAAGEDPEATKVWHLVEPEKLLDELYAVEGLPVEYYTGRIIRRAGLQYVRHNYHIETHNTRAFVTVLPDGTKVLSDGTGCEIRLQGGSIHISAPENIYLTAGKNIFFSAGSNVDMLAQGSIQMVTSIEHIKMHAAGILHPVGEGKCIPCANLNAVDPSCTASTDCLCASGCDQFPCGGGIKIESPQTVVVDSRDISLLGRSYIYAHCLDARTITVLDLWGREGHFCHLTAATQCTDVSTVSAYLNVCSLNVYGTATKTDGNPLWGAGATFPTYGSSPIDCSANTGAIARKLLAKKLAAAPCNFLVDKPRFKYEVPEPRWHRMALTMEERADQECPDSGFSCPVTGSALQPNTSPCPSLPYLVLPSLNADNLSVTGTGEVEFKYVRYKLPPLLNAASAYDADYVEDFCEYLEAMASASTGSDLSALGISQDARAVAKLHPRITVRLECTTDPNCT